MNRQSQNPAEPVEPGEPDPVEPGEPERLFAGKYKTVEDMENAYLESQKNFHADRQEKGALKREIEEIKTLLVAKPPNRNGNQARRNKRKTLRFCGKG